MPHLPLPVSGNTILHSPVPRLSCHTMWTGWFLTSCAFHCSFQRSQNSKHPKVPACLTHQVDHAVLRHSCSSISPAWSCLCSGSGRDLLQPHLPYTRLGGGQVCSIVWGPHSCMFCPSSHSELEGLPVFKALPGVQDWPFQSTFLPLENLVLQINFCGHFQWHWYNLSVFYVVSAFTDFIVKLFCLFPNPW